MKFLKYVSVFIPSVLIGIFSTVWYWLVRDFRAKARNIVYNYMLQNDKPIWQINNYLYSEKFDGYITEIGYVQYTEVSYIKYLWWKWTVWIWLDDDCENDTYNINVINKKSWYKTNKSYFGKILLNNTLGYELFGTAFALGDNRADKPATATVNEIHHLFTSITNFDHMYGYTTDTKYLFNLTIRGRMFGWEYFDTIDSVDIYKLVFNKKKY